MLSWKREKVFTYLLSLAICHRNKINLNRATKPHLTVSQYPHLTQFSFLFVVQPACYNFYSCHRFSESIADASNVHLSLTGHSPSLLVKSTTNEDGNWHLA